MAFRELYMETLIIMSIYFTRSRTIEAERKKSPDTLLSISDTIGMLVVFRII